MEFNSTYKHIQFTVSKALLEILFIYLFIHFYSVNFRLGSPYSADNSFKPETFSP